MERVFLNKILLFIKYFLRFFFVLEKEFEKKNFSKIFKDFNWYS